MKFISIFFVVLVLLNFRVYVCAQINDTEVLLPVDSQNIQENAPSKIDIDELRKSTVTTGFPDSIVIDKKLKIKTETFIDPKQSMSGDFFKAQVSEDLFLPLPSEQPFLIISQGSWITGRLSHVKKPTLFSMSVKVTIGLDQLTTPTGEIIPLSANLELQENYASDLTPPTDSPAVLVSSSFLDKEIAGKLIDGLLVGLFTQSENLIVYKGQELQILLNKTLQFVSN